MGKWKVSVENGSVCFGSAYDKWAISKYIMEKYKINFKQVFELTQEGEEGLKKLQEVAPIDEATLAMIIDHLPTPDGGAGIQDTADMARRPEQPRTARR